MKKMIAVILLSLLVSGTTFANSQTHSDSHLELAATSLLNALKSDNAGVRNSALYQIAKFKVQYPQVDLTKVTKQVEKLAKKDKSPIVRVNANLAESVLTDINASTQVNLSVNEPQAFFSDLYNKIYYPDNDF